MICAVAVVQGRSASERESEDETVVHATLTLQRDPTYLVRTNAQNLRGAMLFERLTRRLQSGSGQTEISSSRSLAQNCGTASL